MTKNSTAGPLAAQRRGVNCPQTYGANLGGEGGGKEGGCFLVRHAASAPLALAAAAAAAASSSSSSSSAASAAGATAAAVGCS
jgi:hypothetical protein